MTLIWDRSVALYVNKETHKSSPGYLELFYKKLDDMGVQFKNSYFVAFCEECGKEFIDNGETVCLLTVKEEQISSIEPHKIMFYGVKCPTCRARCRILSVYEQHLTPRARAFSLSPRKK